jgi:hypothetical protein
MSHLRKVVFIGILVLFLCLGISCSMVPKGIQNLFATKTPTPTNTATSTPTPTVTSTPTNTPMPPVVLQGCFFIEDCPSENNLYDLLGYSPQSGSINDIEFPYNETAWVTMGWTAKDQATIEENAKKIHWILEVDGQDYFNPDWTGFGFKTDEDDPSITYPGIWLGMTLSGWKIGESHQIKIGYSFDEPVNDGWDSYPAGTGEVFTYIVKPVNMPTATPTATATRTNTPRPTAIPYTKTPKPTLAPTNPPCSIDSTIEIDNTTGGIVTINLSGPMKFHFELPTGHTSMQVCSGSYSYKAWGCGGATDSGTLGSGEAHEFYCQ